MKYNAFISYNHAQDDDLGTSLEKSLEKFAKPLFKRRALEIFRDANDLSLSPDLGDKIREGLMQSEYFVCLASRPYAQSKWCKREVDIWLEHKSIDTFIIVLTDGDIFYDEDQNDFDWKRTTALPDNLSGVFKGEPFYLDFRNLGPKENLNLDNPEYRKRLVLLAATIHGKSVGNMEGEAARQHRRMLRIRNATIAVLSGLLIIAILASIFAVKKKNEALLSTYIANSQAQFEEDPTKSLRLAEVAYKFAKDKGFSTTEAAEQLIKVFYSGYGFYQDPSLSFPDFREEPISRKIQPTSPFEQGLIRLSDSILQSIPRDDFLGNQWDLFLDGANNSGILVVSSNALKFSRIYFIEQSFDSYEIQSSDIILPGFTGYTSYIQDVDISKDGRFTILGSANGKTAYIENEGYRYNADKNIFKDRAILKSSDVFPVRYVSFVENENYIGVASFETEYINGRPQDKERTTYYYKTSPYPYIEMINTENEHGNSSLDGQYFMEPLSEDSDSYIWFHFKQIIRNSDGDIIAKFPGAKGASHEIDNSPNKEYIFNYQGVFNTHNELLITLNLDTIDNPGVAVCFSTDSRFFKVSYLNGLQRIFALDPEFIIKRINNTGILGNIAPLSDKDKDRFLVED